MKDALPHPRLRTAIFWFLVAAWPVFWIAYDLAPPGRGEWFRQAGTMLAVVSSVVHLFGKFLYQDTQRAFGERLDEVERCWQLLTSGRRRRPALQVIRRGGDQPRRHLR